MVRVPERVQYKIAVLMCKVLRGLAPQYLGPSTMSPTCLVADLPLRSAGTNRLAVPPVSRQPSPTNRAFPVVGPRTLNDLPDDVTSACHLPSATQNSPVHEILFRDYFLDWTPSNLSLVDLAVILMPLFTATCFSNVAVMGSLDVRPSVRPSVRP